MRIVILHNQVLPDAGPDNLDTLVQARAVAEALKQRGHRVTTRELGADVWRTLESIREESAHVVFNLIESFEGSDNGAALLLSMLEELEIPFTGSDSEALRLSTNKLLAKQILRSQGIPTPNWYDLCDFGGNPSGLPELSGTFICKSVDEHASWNLDHASVVQAADRNELLQYLRQRMRSHSGKWFAEAYVPGREINIGILETAQSPLLLPPAEMLFEGYAAGDWKIMDYASKWDLETDNRRISRSYDFDAADTRLLEAVRDSARKVWKAFGLRGYARIDFRFDPDSPDAQPMVIDVNANPCLAPDAGFAAALEQEGLSYAEGIQLIAQAGAALGPRSPKNSGGGQHAAEEYEPVF